MIRRIRWFCQKQSASATPNANSEPTSRERSSVRWSTTVSRSSWETGGLGRRATGAQLPLGALLARGGGGLALAVHCAGAGRVGGALPGGQLVAVVARHRVLELAHPAAER